MFSTTNIGLNKAVFQFVDLFVELLDVGLCFRSKGCIDKLVGNNFPFILQNVVKMWKALIYASIKVTVQKLKITSAPTLWLATTHTLSYGVAGIVLRRGVDYYGVDFTSCKLHCLLDNKYWFTHLYLSPVYIIFIAYETVDLVCHSKFVLQT